MAIRLLHATPGQILSMSTPELLTAIRISEGRTLAVCARVRSANLVDYVTNAEVAAAFGADIVIVDTYEPANPYIPGWTSKNPQDDELTKNIQVPMGKGYTLKEIRELIGRPVALLLTIPYGSDPGLSKHYGNILATDENVEKGLESGADIIFLGGWAPADVMAKSLRAIRRLTEGKAILEYARPHGPGLIGRNDYSLGPSALISEDEVRLLLDEGMDVVGLPCPGTYPGFSLEYTCRLVEMIHNGGALAALGLHTSQEGSDIDTIERLAVLAKMAGADIHELGDSGFNECMIEPQNIMAYSIAIRGRRHTYRRMAMSINR
jgi:hypothetical protein